MRHAPAPARPPDAPATSAGPADHPSPGRRRRPRWWHGAVAVAVLTVLVGAVALWPRADPGPTADEVNGIVDRKVGAAVEALQAQPPASVAVYEAIRPPLVAVQIQRSGAPGSRPGLGSGVIVNAEGEILTSLHVVEGAAGITVSFADGSESPAAVTASDPDHDIAVLTPARLPEVVVPAVLGGGAQVGDEVFAVGHPLGLVGSLSAGVISGLDRSFPLANGRTLAGMIQFDAAVNPGNSGGPLLNRNGQVIGIVTGLANPSGDNFIGIGFAVPIGTAGGAAGAPAR